MRRRTAIATAALVLAAFAAAFAARALTVQSVNPLWLQEHFTDTAAVTAAGGACIDTAAPGVARLCEAPWTLATDPAQPRYFVADRQGRAWLFASAGGAVVDVSGLLPAIPGAVYDAGWGAGALAVLTVDGRVYGYAQDSGGRLAPAPGYQMQVPGAVSVAAGPGLVLAAGPASVSAYAWDGAGLRRLPALDLAVAVRQVRLTGDGTRLLAVLPDGRLQTWARAETGWTPGPGIDGPVTTAAFMPSGAGLWAGAGSAVRAWAFSLDGGLAEIGSWRIAAQARAAAPGFGGQDVLLLTGGGADYYAAEADGASRVEAYSAALPAGVAYEPQGTVTGAVYNADHTIDMLRVEAQETLPPGTSTAYEVSTDCGVTWTATAANTNVQVPPGSCIAWRVTLATADPAVTPAVDVVDVYELAQQTRAARQGEVILRLIQ